MNILAMLSNASEGMSAAGSFASQGTLTFGGPLMAFEAANAQRGEMVSSLAGSGAGLLMTPVIAAPIGAAMVALIPGVGTGMVMSTIAGILAGEVTDMLANKVRKDFRKFTQLDRNVRSLRMGGSYADTELAQRQRMIAIQEMSGTVTTSRRYLGQEALLFHR